MTTNLADSKSTMAKSDDGTIQLTFTIPFSVIEKEREKALKSLGENMQIAGFRKGQAPIEKVIEQVNQNTLLEKTLSGILPKLFGDAIKEHKIEPIIYPKFELVKGVDGEDWQIRANTCEAPKIDLSGYKDKIKGALRSGEIWTPGKGDPGKKPESKEKTAEEKQQIVLKTLLESVTIKIPKLLVEEEANNKLSNLLERLEKLGLTLESYLASIGKTAENIRADYEKQAKEGISLDFILSDIAKTEKLEVEKSEIDASFEAASKDPNFKAENDTPERRGFVEAILRRRKALNYLLNLK